MQIKMSVYCFLGKYICIFHCQVKIVLKQIVQPNTANKTHIQKKSYQLKLCQLGAKQSF